MTRRLVGGLMAAAFGVGILTGSAGAIVLGDTIGPPSRGTEVMAAHMSDMSSMMSIMAGGSMMGTGASMMPGSSSMPMDGSGHEAHHPSVPAGSTR